MTNGSPESLSGGTTTLDGAPDPGAPAPILVLGLGNTLLTDDGFGPTLVEQLADSARDWGGQVEFLDGGTQGLALLGRLARRRALIIVDALTTGAPAGTVHRLTLPELRELTPARGPSAHEGNAGELLAAVQLLDELPDRLFVVGVEPQEIRTGFGLSAPRPKRALRRFRPSHQSPRPAPLSRLRAFVAAAFLSRTSRGAEAGHSWVLRRILVPPCSDSAFCGTYAAFCGTDTLVRAQVPPRPIL